MDGKRIDPALLLPLVLFVALAAGPARAAELTADEVWGALKQRYAAAQMLEYRSRMTVEGLPGLPKPVICGVECRLARPDLSDTTLVMGGGHEQRVVCDGAYVFGQIDEMKMVYVAGWATGSLIASWRHFLLGDTTAVDSAGLFYGKAPEAQIREKRLGPTDSRTRMRSLILKFADGAEETLKIGLHDSLIHEIEVLGPPPGPDEERRPRIRYREVIRTAKTSDTVDPKLFALKIPEGYKCSVKWIGKVQFGEQSYEVALEDATRDEAWGDRWTMNGRGDQVWVDVDGDGHPGSSRTGVAEQFPVGRYLVLGGRCFEIEVKPDGTALAAKPASVTLGDLKLVPDGARVTLVSDEGALVIEAAKGAIKAPVGRYRMSQYALSRTDKDGRQWELQAAGISGREVNVSALAPAEVSLIGPLELRISADVTPGKLVYLSLYLADKDGGRITSVTVGSKPPDPPRFTIKGPDGRVVKEGEFEYG